MVKQRVDTIGLSMLPRIAFFLLTRGLQVDSTELQKVFLCRYGMHSETVSKQIQALKDRGVISVDVNHRIMLCSAIINRVF